MIEEYNNNTKEYKNYIIMYNVDNSDKEFKLNYLNSSQIIKLNLQKLD